MTLEKVLERKKILDNSLLATQKKLETLRANIAQTEADIHAISGAVQDCEYWISELNKEEAITEELQETEEVT